MVASQLRPVPTWLFRNVAGTWVSATDRNTYEIKQFIGTLIMKQSGIMDNALLCGALPHLLRLHDECAFAVPQRYAVQVIDCHWVHTAG